MTDWTTTAESVTDTIGHAANIALRLGADALPIIQFVAGFIPGAAPAVQILSVAIPIIAKIAAGAPIARQAIEAGRPVIDALAQHAPEVIGHLKELYAVAANADPKHPATDMKAADVSHTTLAAWVPFRAGSMSFPAPPFSLDFGASNA